MQNVSKEAEKTAGNIADAAPQIADRVSDRLVKEADQVGREVKPAAEKAANRLGSEAEQLGKEARPMADKASANIEAGARKAGEQARPAADKASDAMKKGANDASGEQIKHHLALFCTLWLCKAQLFQAGHRLWPALYVCMWFMHRILLCAQLLRMCMQRYLQKHRYGSNICTHAYQH